jgi:hypothetical protein
MFLAFLFIHLSPMVIPDTVGDMRREVVSISDDVVLRHAPFSSVNY